MNHKKHSGRGSTPKLKLEQRFCPQGKNGVGCESTFLRKAKRILRRLEQLQHLYNNQQACSWKANHLWEIVTSQFNFFSNLCQLCTTKERPSGAELDAWIGDVRETVRKAQAAEVAQRVQIARNKLQQNWQDAPAAVYSKIDPHMISPTVLLQTPDDRFTGNSVEFSELLFKAWLPIFGKFSSQPEPSWEEFSNVLELISLRRLT